MAEEIVACPGCAKKFRIPEGAPPGAFPCTACGVSVPYGAQPVAAAKGGAARGAAKPAQRTTAAPAARAAAPAQPARAASSQRVSSSRAAPASSRRQPAYDEEPPKKSNQGLIWGGIVLGGGGLIFLVYSMTKPPEPAPSSPSTTTQTAAAKPGEQPKPATSKPAEQPKPTEQPKPPVEQPKPPTPAAQPKKPDEPAKPGSSTYASLGQTFASVTGVGDEERGQLDKYVALAMDRDSAREGAEAEGKLIKAGKKSIPSILSAFSKQFNGAKWAGDLDQWSADKLQDILHRITGASGINPDYYPRFNSGESSEAFQKAATMWISWWNNKGQSIDKFKPRND